MGRVVGFYFILDGILSYFTGKMRTKSTFHSGGVCNDSGNGLGEHAWPMGSLEPCEDLPASNSSSNPSRRVLWDVPRVEHAEERHVRDHSYLHLNLHTNTLR